MDFVSVFLSQPFDGARVSDVWDLPADKRGKFLRSCINRQMIYGCADLLVCRNSPTGSRENPSDMLRMGPQISGWHRVKVALVVPFGQHDGMAVVVSNLGNSALVWRARSAWGRGRGLIFNGGRRRILFQMTLFCLILFG